MVIEFSFCRMVFAGGIASGFADERTSSQNPQVGWVEANRLLNSAADKKLNSPNRRGPVCTVVYREASDGLPMSILSFDYRRGIGGAFLFEKLLTGGIRLVPNLFYKFQ
jgi:hypothetical protein